MAMLSWQQTRPSLPAGTRFGSKTPRGGGGGGSTARGAQSLEAYDLALEARLPFLWVQSGEVPLFSSNDWQAYDVGMVRLTGQKSFKYLLALPTPSDEQAFFLG